MHELIWDMPERYQMAGFIEERDYARFALEGTPSISESPDGFLLTKPGVI